MSVVSNIFDETISPERLFEAWYEFRRGKSNRRDVQDFGRHAEKHIFRLHRDLASGAYRHSPYESFFVHDPKRRHIRKACVRDRLVHHTLHMTLRQIFEPRLYSGVYSNRIGKGTHRAVDALQRAVWKVSKNLTHPCWALKCDIRDWVIDDGGRVLRSDCNSWLHPSCGVPERLPKENTLTL